MVRCIAGGRLGLPGILAVRRLLRRGWFRITVVDCLGQESVQTALLCFLLFLVQVRETEDDEYLENVEENERVQEGLDVTVVAIYGRQLVCRLLGLYV